MDARRPRVVGSESGIARFRDDNTESEHVRRDGWRHGHRHGWYGYGKPWGWLKQRYLERHYGWERGGYDGWRR